jgi:hypothetical protein
MSIKNKEHYFKEEFITILINIINSKNLNAIYNIDKNVKYSIEYITDIIITVSNKYGYNKYKLLPELANFLNKSTITRFTRSGIKSIVKSLIISCDKDNTSFINKYVVIGHDIIKHINELNVII